MEATGASFANTWKAQSSCQDKLDWLDNPCSLNIESGEARPRPGQLGRLVDGVWVREEVRPTLLRASPSTCCPLPCGHGGSPPSERA